MCKWLYSESCTNNIPIIQECCCSLCHRSYPPTTVLQCLKALFFILFFFLEWCTNHLRVALSILKKWGRCCITKCIWHYCVIAQFVVLHHWQWNCFSVKPPLFLTFLTFGMKFKCTQPLFSVLSHYIHVFQFLFVSLSSTIQQIRLISRV